MLLAGSYILLAASSKIIGAIKVNGNWRLTFAFELESAILVDYQDYH